MVATWLAYAGYYFCRKAFYVVKETLATELGFDGMTLAHLGTGYLAGYVLGQFSSAFFGRKLGPRLLLLCGMGISIGCNIAFGINNGFWSMLVFMTLNGMAQGTGWPGCIGSLGYWFTRKKRGSVLGLWSTCYQIGSVAATSWAAFLLGHFGWRWSFFGASMILLIVWILVLVLHPNTPEDVGYKSVKEEDQDPDTQQTQPTKGNSSDTPTSAGLGWNRQILVTILMMGSIYFCIKFLRYALWSWAPFFLSKNFSLQGDQAGYLSIVFDVFGFIGVVLAGFVSDRLFAGRRSQVSLFMLVCMLVSFWAMWVWGSHSTIAFAICMGCAGFMLYGPDSLLSGVGAIDVGSVRSAMVAAGIINGMGSIGPIFQEQLIGWMYEHYHQDLVPILLVFVFVAACSAILMALLTLRSRRGKANL